MSTDRPPISVLVLALACAVATLIAAALAVVIITSTARTNELNRDLFAQIKMLTTQNRGPRGDDGLSAYQLALANGFVGTETEWLQSLKGDAGTNGIDGRDGTNGSTGTPGASVGSVVCNGTSISFYTTTGTYIGSVKAVCIP